jgi:cytochrome c5
MRRRVLRWLCARRGHQPAIATAGTYQGYFIRATICPRCHAIFRSEVGPGRDRRRAWRERLAER